MLPFVVCYILRDTYVIWPFCCCCSIYVYIFYGMKWRRSSISEYLEAVPQRALFQDLPVLVIRKEFMSRGLLIFSLRRWFHCICFYFSFSKVCIRRKATIFLVDLIFYALSLAGKPSSSPSLDERKCENSFLWLDWFFFSTSLHR